MASGDLAGVLEILLCQCQGLATAMISHSHVETRRVQSATVLVILGPRAKVMDVPPTLTAWQRQETTTHRNPVKQDYPSYNHILKSLKDIMAELNMPAPIRPQISEHGLSSNLFWDAQLFHPPGVVLFGSLPAPLGF